MQEHSIEVNRLGVDVFEKSTSARTKSERFSAQLITLTRHGCNLRSGSPAAIASLAKHQGWLTCIRNDAQPFRLSLSFNSCLDYHISLMRLISSHPPLYRYCCVAGYCCAPTIQQRDWKIWLYHSREGSMTGRTKPISHNRRRALK